ncbi:MAG: hypothetical protein ACI361_03265 [Atopobiaceae bacterium]
MSNAKAFFEANDQELDLFTKAITKAHGAHHPEVFEVRKIYEAVQRKMRGGVEDVRDEMLRLRAVTRGYAIPSDACGAFARTYQLLSELDSVVLG